MGTWLEPEWEPERKAGSARDWEPNWGQTGTKLAPNLDQTSTKLGPKLDQIGTQLRSGTGPAPGSQKVPKVCNCRHKQARAPIAGTGRYQILGPPRGLSKIPY